MHSCCRTCMDEPRSFIGPLFLDAGKDWLESDIPLSSCGALGQGPATQALGIRASWNRMVFRLFRFEEQRDFYGASRGFRTRERMISVETGEATVSGAPSSDPPSQDRWQGSSSRVIGIGAGSQGLP